ncbi:cupin domain-containing protein [Proteiniclasticum sp. C24MP]|uniref:cupin domain-containing protein n=1 Tax=Proteiniclasticum sp. C24MP TaxID=3374101 RepID=UPI0037541118
MQINQEKLEAIIRKVLMEEMGGAKPPIDKHVDEKSGVLVVKGRSVKPEPFDTGKPGTKVFLSDIMTLEESPRLMAGIMEMDESSFPWTLEYDEVDYIIDGVLEIKINDSVVRGVAGDIIFIPKGSSISFVSPGKSRFLYVTYPADWAEQE